MEKRAGTNRHTRERMLDSLVELMKTEAFSDISVTAITKLAGVSRMAYYRSYTCKEDILKRHLKEIADRAMQNSEARESMSACLLCLIEELSPYRDMTLAIHRAHLGCLPATELARMLTKLFLPQKHANSVPVAYGPLFLAGAFYNTYVHWLLDGETFPKEELVALCVNMLNQS